MPLTKFYFTARHAFAILFLLLAVGICIGQVDAAESKAEPDLILGEILDDNGQIVLPQANLLGFIQYVERKLGRNFNIKTYPWKRALDHAEHGDGIIFGVSKSPSRLNKLRFSEPIYAEQSWLVTRCDSQFAFNRIQDLQAKTIGVVRGAVTGDEFDRQANKLFTIEDDTGAYPARFMKLYQKRVDALVYYLSAANTKNVDAEIAQRYGVKFAKSGSNSASIFCTLPKPIDEAEIFFATSLHHHSALLREINQIIVAARRNGDLRQFFYQHERR